MQEIIMAGVGALAGAGGCWALLAAAPQLNPLAQRRTLAAAEEELTAVAQQQSLESEQIRKEMAVYDRRETERASAEQLGRALQIANDTGDPVQALRAWLAEHDGASAQEAAQQTAATKTEPKVSSFAHLDIDELMHEILITASEIDSLMCSQPEHIESAFFFTAGPNNSSLTPGQTTVSRELHASLDAAKEKSRIQQIGSSISIAQLQCVRCALSYMSAFEASEYNSNPRRILLADTGKIQNRMPIPIRKRFQRLNKLGQELENRA